jgi:hypothetical protein
MKPAAVVKTLSAKALKKLALHLPDAQNTERPTDGQTATAPGHREGRHAGSIASATHAATIRPAGYVGTGATAIVVSAPSLPHPGRPTSNRRSRM